MKKRKGPQSDKYMMTMLECIIKRKNKAIIQVTRKPQLIFNCKKGDLLLSWPLSLRSIVAWSYLILYGFSTFSSPSCPISLLRVVWGYLEKPRAWPRLYSCLVILDFFSLVAQSVLLWNLKKMSKYYFLILWIFLRIHFIKNTYASSQFLLMFLGAGDIVL